MSTLPILLWGCTVTPPGPTEATASADTSATEPSVTDTASTSVSTPTTVDTAAADTGLAPVRVPDFALKDRNPTSASFDELVSPRDQIGRVSVWYFGHST